MISLLAQQYRERSAAWSDIRVQLPILYAWAHHPGARIIELGTRTGESTCAFLAGIERGGSNGQLWSVDLDIPQVPLEWKSLPYWHLLVADSCSAEAIAFCPDEVDMLFSDTSHLYDLTLAELRAYVPKVRQGGIVLVHDTNTPGTGPPWPDVPRALDDFCAGNRLSWYSHPDWNGLGVIEIPVLDG